MSQPTPQVGQIWKQKGFEYQVTFIFGYANEVELTPTVKGSGRKTRKYAPLLPFDYELVSTPQPTNPK